MSQILLVHLVRKSNGLGPFRIFLESYKACHAGVNHDLLIIFKGFGSGETLEHEELLKEMPHFACHVPDIGFDITPYFYAVRNFEYPYFVFLNSFSIILCDGWLEKMYAHVTRPSVGAVGATGSWESMCSAPYLGFARDILIRTRQYSLRRHFPAFPNCHLRSNAFMAAREVLLAIQMPTIFGKEDAHKFESGRNSFTRQIFSMNRKVLVVGCDGKSYEKEEWPSSYTFRQKSQHNLLVADNQTDAYLSASSEMRRNFSLAAWGKASEPD